ncbi:MAG: ankyrin repeat domain-containing protein [Vulcanimicrobiota bacterium]
MSLPPSVHNVIRSSLVLALVGLTMVGLSYGYKSRSQPGPAMVSPPGPTVLTLQGRVTLGGVDVRQRHYYEDAELDGLPLLERGGHWARYGDGKVEVLVTCKPATGLVEGMVSNALCEDGAPVLWAASPYRELPRQAEYRLSQAGIRREIDESGNLRVFAWGDYRGPLPGQSGCAALLKAHEHRDLAAFEAALDKQTANLIWCDGRAYLTHLAQDADNLVYVRALLKAGADPGADGGEGVREADPETARLLLAAGAPPDFADAFGRTRLFECQPDLARMLLDAGADPNHRDIYERTPLFGADEELAKLLLEAGADPSLADPSR